MLGARLWIALESASGLPSNIPDPAYSEACAQAPPQVSALMLWTSKRNALIRHESIVHPNQEPVRVCVDLCRLAVQSVMFTDVRELKPSCLRSWFM
jgi:hypothetical protein